MRGFKVLSIKLMWGNRARGDDNNAIFKIVIFITQAFYSIVIENENNGVFSNGEIGR